MKEHDMADFKSDDMYNCKDCLDTGFCIIRGADGVAREDICLYCKIGDSLNKDVRDYITDLDTIKKIIRNTGVTKLAREAKISRQTLYNIMNDVHDLSHKHYLVIMNAFDRIK